MYKDKLVLVVGMARSGISAAERLIEAGAKVVINDSKKDCDISELKGEVYGKIFGTQPSDIEQYDMIVLSPGVPKSLKFIEDAIKKNIEVIGELELGYRLSSGTFYGITGTNGKTTTTALTESIFKEGNKDSYAVGNIGRAITSVCQNTTDDTHLITEVSSFQLESVDKFNVHIGAILNLTEDHLNRHKTMENYIDAKCNIFKNQREEDFLVLNYDDKLTRELSSRSIKSKIIYFSRKEILKEGFYVEDNAIYSNLDIKEKIIDIKDIKIIGEHNIENVLAAIAISTLAGIDKSIINKGIKSFKGVEHRIEYVDTIDGVDCYNDSKGTNPESSIVGVKTMIKPTVLIAGGMDKGSEFDEFIKSFDDKVKILILLGETKDIIEKTALKYDFKNILKVNTMEEAVDLAFLNSVSGDAILLSPACASWDMYDSFEVRGQEFKSFIERRK